MSCESHPLVSHQLLTVLINGPNQCCWTTLKKSAWKLKPPINFFFYFFFFFAVSNRTMWAKIKLLSSYHICMLQNYFPQQLSVECGVSEMWLTLTQYGIVKRELGRVSRVLGECIETTGEGVPQQAASWHMGVHAVLDDLGRREEMREESERAGGRGCRRI